MDQQVKAPAMPAILNLSLVSWDAHGARRILLSQAVLWRTHGKCASQQVNKLKKYQNCGWKYSSSIKSVCACPEFPAPMRKGFMPFNSSSRDSDALFWPPWEPVHMYNTYKMNLFLKRRNHYKCKRFDLELFSRNFFFKLNYAVIFFWSTATNLPRVRIFKI